METLQTLEDTLFLPVLSRIYASEHFPAILTDPKALELKAKLPEHLRGQKMHNQYGALAGAVRSANFDRCIKAFLEDHPDGVVVQLGCGLETAFQRCDNGKALWVDVDTSEVMQIRKTVLRESDRERFCACDPFFCQWLAQIRANAPQTPVLVAAQGLFHQHDRQKVEKLFWEMQAMGPVQVLFDALSERASKRMEGYVQNTQSTEKSKKMPDFFYVNDASALAAHLGGGAKVLLEEKAYAHTDLSGLGFLARSAMRKSDRSDLMKTVLLAL